MPNPKLLVEPSGLDAQFRLIPDDDEREEGQLDDDDDDDDEEEEEEEKVDQNANNNGNDANGGDKLENPETKKPAKIKSKPKISLFEMQSFLIALILPEPRLSTPPTWCRVLRCLRAANVGIFLLDNEDLDWIENKGSKFTHAFRFDAAPNWIESLTSVPLSRRQQNLAAPSMFGAENGIFERDLNAMPRVSKTELLLSPLQMIVENYPLPEQDGIKILRKRFTEPNNDSPIFAIDCEMCMTYKSELTKVSIVDEELRVVYDELVKPDQPITNYLTRYSGITESMMENVGTTIDDVHSFMRENIPRDAIFCGHSLNNDLTAMQIYHPYVIDTSVIYNRSGIRHYKPSLKSLAYELLGREIQTSNQIGHDSLEDAITAMELVKLKLVNGILFGDSVAYERSQGLRYDSKTGTTNLQIDKFIEKHKVTTLSYRFIDTTPGARCLYIHDKQGPLDQGVKDTINYLLEKNSAICVILTNSGECYVKF